MSEKPRFQYSLRTLLIIMTASAVIMGLLKSLGMLPPMYFEAAIVYLLTCLLLPGFFLGVMLFLSSIVRLSRSFASLDPLSPQRLASFTSELQAEVLVDALATEGIRGMAVGGYTAGFRAEAPGEVQVVVASRDLLLAREILEAFEAEAASAVKSESERGADEQEEY
jgi:hypothetical protein